MTKADPHWDQVIKGMQIVTSLPRLPDHWDNIRLSDGVARHALALARQFRRNRLTAPDRVVPTQSGSIVFIWDDETEYREIEIVGRNRIDTLDMALDPGRKAMPRIEIYTWQPGRRRTAIRARCRVERAAAIILPLAFAGGILTDISGLASPWAGFFGVMAVGVAVASAWDAMTRED